MFVVLFYTCTCITCTVYAKHRTGRLVWQDDGKCPASRCPCPALLVRILLDGPEPWRKLPPLNQSRPICAQSLSHLARSIAWPTESQDHDFTGLRRCCHSLNLVWSLGPSCLYKLPSYGEMQQQHATAERRVKKTRSCGREKVESRNSFSFSSVVAGDVRKVGSVKRRVRRALPGDESKKCTRCGAEHIWKSKV